jgi:hypothetical protein
MVMHRSSVRVGGCVVLLTAFTAAASAEPIPIGMVAFSGNEPVVQFGVAATQPLPYSEDGSTFGPYSGFAASVLSVNNILLMGDGGRH